MTFHLPDIKPEHGAYHHIVPIIFILFLVIFSSCSEHSRYQSELDQAEELMETYPDSAITVIDGIDEKQLGGSQERARYALLKSMALDKNYVDTTDFAVLQPAIDHYLRHGSPDQRLRTLFYQGRIFQNRGDNAAAMTCYLQAQDLDHITDTLTLARLLTWQGLIQKSIYDFEGYTSSNLKASRLFSSLNKPSQLNCLLNALDGAILLENKPMADSLLNHCKFLSKALDAESILEPYSLSYFIEFADGSEIRDCISSLNIGAEDTAETLLSAANALCRIGEYSQAKRILDIAAEKLDDEYQIRFLGLSVLANKGLGKYQEALDDYMLFSQKMDSIHSIEFEQKARFSRERYEMETQLKNETHEKQKVKIVTVCVTAILFLCIALLILIYRNVRFKTENLKHRISELNNEREDLQKLLESQKEIPDTLKQVLKERYDLLSSFFASEITENENRILSSKKKVQNLIADKKSFMRNNRLALQNLYPDFITHLQTHGLTDAEVDYVCLYAIGLKGKEVGEYLESPGHINLSSAIRKKLGLSRTDTSLGLHIRSLLK